MRSPVSVLQLLPEEARRPRSRTLWALALVGVLVASLQALVTSPAAAVRCATPDLKAYTSQIQPVLNPVPSHQPGDPRRPPDNPQVGDSWMWYTWRLNGPPTADPKLCTVRGIGQNVYIVVENSQWLTHVSQADVDHMVDAWDHHSLGQWPTKGIYQLDSENFGPVPDELDNDPKVYVLWYDFDINADGFFWAFDEFPDGSQPYHSNECEVLYLNSSDFPPGGDYLTSVQAHEFQHMIHWLADQDEDSWLNEGMGELAMWLYGHPDDVVSFPSTPDISLTTFSSGFADYVKTYLWSLYFYEHFGGQPSVFYLVQNTSNSITSVQQTLTHFGNPTTFPQLMRDWYTANYLDDPTIDGGRYNYAGEDLPPFAAITKSTYPVPVTNATVNHWASDYVKFINGQPLVLNFDGGDTSDWTARAITFQAGVPLAVLDIPLNAQDAGSVALAGFGSSYDQVVMVAGNVSTGGVTSYSYSTTGDPLDAPNQDALVAGLRLDWAGPNPFSAGTALRLTLDRAAHVDASVHDAGGRLVQSLAAGPMAAGVHDIRWDGRQASGADAAAGVYFLKVADDSGRNVSRRLLLVR